jgi:chemotaxis protein histidine kinase CheA
MAVGKEMSSDIDKHEVEQQIKELTERFSRKLPSRINEIRKLYEELLYNNPENSDNVNRMHDIAHTMAGSSGSFGLEKVSDSFKKLETYIDENSLPIPLKADDEHSKVITNKIDAIEIAISEQLLKE